MWLALLKAVFAELAGSFYSLTPLSPQQIKLFELELLLLDHFLPHIIKVHVKLLAEHLSVLQDVLLANQWIQQGSHAKALTSFELLVHHMILKLDRHGLFVLTEHTMVE